MLNLHRRGDEDIAGDASQEREKNADSRKRSEKSVTVYLVTLFVVVLLLLFLSYFIQQKRNSATISDLTEQHSVFSTQALQNIEELQNKNIQLTEDLEAAEDEAETLRAQLKESEDKLTTAMQDKENAEKKNEESGKKLRALETLASAMLASESGDKESAKAALELIEKDKLAGYLDGHWKEDLDALREKLG